jgi:CheY-like chemotaxis protein
MPLIEVQGHELSVAVPPESLMLVADPVRLAQVIGNLLTNAAKYTEANGHIWLSAVREGRQVSLSIRDNGIGIEPDMLPHVFDLFVQLEQAATKSQGGLGIGLTLVKNLIEMHGGSVEARSAGLGEGSEFIVRLPLSCIEHRIDSGDDGDGRQVDCLSSGHRLLVVDDNEDAANSLALLLKLKGHHVQVAHHGTSALKIAENYRPDMIFLDIGMPGMDGYEVARRLRQHPELKNVVLAALTGWGQQEDRRRSAEAGFDHHLVKPPELKLVDSLLSGLGQRNS